MTDLWSFLLQTLTASGVAVLLLAVKALFADKLSPRWQFGIWGLLALTLLLPAGLGGRYVLFQWPLLIETVKTLLTGSYTLTRVVAPIPLFAGIAPGWPGLLFALYLAGGLLLLLHYLYAYLRLRLILRRGTPPSAQTAAQLDTQLHADAQQTRKLTQFLQDLDLDAQCSVFYDTSDHLRVEIEGSELAVLEEDEMQTKLSELLGIPLRPPQWKEGERERIVFLELEPLAAVIGVAARRKENETINGDNGSYFKTDDGILYIILADGMGSWNGFSKPGFFPNRR